MAEELLAIIACLLTLSNVLLGYPVQLCKAWKSSHDVSITLIATAACAFTAWTGWAILAQVWPAFCCNLAGAIMATSLTIVLCRNAFCSNKRQELNQSQDKRLDLASGFEQREKQE